MAGVLTFTGKKGSFGIKINGEKSNIEAIAQYGDDFGKMGRYVENPNIKVDWTQYAGHAAKRSDERNDKYYC